MDTWRVQAGASGTLLTTDPVIPGIGGITLNKGEWTEGATDKNFRLMATGPIQVAQYMASQMCTGDGTGDPSQIMGVGISQYRADYPFQVPYDYDTNWVTVVRPVGSSTNLDGTPVSVGFEPLASSGYEVGYVQVQEGPHLMDGTEPFGLTQYGFFSAVSYGNPVGLNLVVGN